MATTPTLSLPPTGYEYGEARRRYVEAMGSTQVMNTYLKLTVLGLAVVAVALVVLNVHTQRTFRTWKPLVIRIDDVGHAAAVSYDSLTYTPQAPELKYFLVQFVTKYYSRIRATVRQSYAESFYFLDGRLADATMDANKKSGLIERFLTGTSEEVEVKVKNVTLDDLRQPPYRATIDFDEVHLAPATRTEMRRDSYVAHVVFVVKDQVDNARIPINPLGLTITYLREDQAFVAEPEGAPMIGNALLAATVLSLAVFFGLLQACTFLIPYRAVLWTVYGPTLTLWAGLAFLNLFAACYAISRTVFLKDTGQKLAHLEKQLRSGSPLSAELAQRLEE